ncbi:MAG: flagellar hook-associated protein FlgL [Chloroflexi bacterium]|nr:flagellar hook-associated protein FlgL [Chloroflexota bacterium]
MRVTQEMMTRNALRDMSASQARIARYQREATTGKRILQPEDDPSGAGQVMGLRAQLANGQMFLRTIASSEDWLNASDTALTTLSQEILARAGELATRGANDSLGPEERRSIAVEIDQLLEQAVATANGDYLGRYLFAGTADTTVPFTTGGTPKAVSYNGNTTAKLREVDRGSTISINLTGEGSILSSLNSLAGLADDLRNNPGNIAARVAELKNRQDLLSTDRAQIGARLTRLQTVLDRVNATQIDFETTRNHVEDADMAETISHLTREDTTYKTILSVNARILPMSLLDFLR